MTAPSEVTARLASPRSTPTARFRLPQRRGRGLGAGHLGHRADRAAAGGTSAQARAGAGYARTDFAIDYDARTVTCPQAKTSASWTPCTQRGQDAIVATFSASDCGPCPARSLCNRLEAFWPGNPLDRRRTSHLARLELGLAA